MHTTSPRTAELTFPGGNGQDQAVAHHGRSLRELVRRLAIRREAHLIRKALDLAGQPNSVLDLPCGTGRLWPVLLEKSNRMIIGADDCADMLAVAKGTYPAAAGRELRYLQTSPFAINLPDCAVDCIFCMRLFPLVGNAAHRGQILREFRRVTRDALILSLWVDGNIQAWRRKALERRRSSDNLAPTSRRVIGIKRIETEFAATGFEILGHLDFLPLGQMARTYVLRKQ